MLTWSASMMSYREDTRTVSNMPWFLRRAVMADVDEDFLSLERYAWDGEFFWGNSFEALSYCVWHENS